MPVRIIKPNYRNITAAVASSKTNRSIMAESSLERDFLIILDFDLNVKFFEEQPLTIKFETKDGERRSYTPDFYVEYRTDIAPANRMKPLLCEIKYRSDLFAGWHLLKPKFKAARLFAKAQGWEFRIVTEVEIRQPYLENAKFLRPFRKHETNWDHYEILTGLLKHLRVASPRQLLLAYSEDKWKQAELLSSLWNLIAQKIIRTDLAEELTMDSELWYPF
jgi:TnsA endonuclease N terminal/TnsA endonuclease C terminal